MSRSLILTIDQGTTGSRALVYDDRGRRLGQAYRELRQYYPKPGWVEHDAMEILRGVLHVCGQAMRAAKRRWADVAAIGVTNQRETVVLWDERDGWPVHRAIVWQCRRTADVCDKLKRAGYGPAVKRATGLVLDPYFSGTKISWLIDHVPGLRRKVESGRILAGTIDSWLVWNLTGRHVTDHTNASRTLLFNIRDHRWDDDLLEILRVPVALRLPRVLPSAAPFGETRRVGPLPAGIRVTGVCGDQQAALYGQAAYRPGEVKNTYGTGCFLVLNTGSKFCESKSGLLTTLACDALGRPVYALEGSVFIAGAAIQWLRDELKIIETSSDSERLARSVPDSGGVVVVPAFSGLGAPHWRADVRGAVFGLTRGSNRAHLARATLESLALQTCDVFDAMKKDAKLKIRELRVDGGAAKNDVLMQIQADLLGVPVIRAANVEATAWGAAKLAGVGVGLWRSPHEVDLRVGALREASVFTPKRPPREVAELRKAWSRAVQCLLNM